MATYPLRVLTDMVRVPQFITHLFFRSVVSPMIAQNALFRSMTVNVSVLVHFWIFTESLHVPSAFVVDFLSPNLISVAGHAVNVIPCWRQNASPT